MKHLCFLWSRYGAGTGTVTCQKSDGSRNCILSKVGIVTGTVKIVTFRNTVRNSARDS